LEALAFARSVKSSLEVTRKKRPTISSILTLRGYVGSICCYLGFIAQQLGATSSTVCHIMNRIFTEDEVLRIGLLYAGFNAHRQHRVERATCERRFKSQYSSSPLVCAKIWEDLITSPDIWENQTHPKAASFEKFLMALNFLKTYQTEEKMAGMWKTCETSARNWAWYFVKKIQALKSKKVSFLASCGVRSCICHQLTCCLLIFSR
jgi:hypothetical protein